MPVFNKQILKPGTYTVPVPDAEGKLTSTKVYLGPDRFKRWVDNFKRMVAAGLRIPAPWRHDEKAAPLRLAADQSDVDAFQNGGFWKDLWVDDDGTLNGQIDVPGEDAATKIGTTVREVSPLVKGKWSDGAGNEYEDAITHIALVTHPVAPGQENFVPIAASLAFSHSQLLLSDDELSGLRENQMQFQAVVEPAAELPEPTTASNATVKDAINVLSELGLTLPADTTPQNILERIVTAGLALRSKQETHVEPNAPPSGASEPRGPVTMSQQTQINTAAASATSPQAELGGFTSPPTPRAETALSLEHQAALNFAAKAGKQRYIDRISALVNTGRITPDYANKTLAPFLQDLQLSFDAQGEPVSTELDKLLLALEALPQNQILGAPLTAAVRRNGDQMFALAVPGAAEIPNDHLWQSADTGTPSEEEAQAIVNQQFENTGRAHMIRGPRNWAGRQS